MYSVGICDDNDNICLQIKEAINEYSRKHAEVINVNIFKSGEEVYEFFLERNNVDLIFLDIELGKLNGVELGVKIRSEFKNENIQIVYISAKQNYAMELFQVRPMNFLVKPINSSHVSKMINKAIELNGKNIFFSFRVGKNLHRRKIKDILYFESIGRKIKMVTINETLYFYDKLKYVLKNVKEYNFLLIHRSIIVNYQYITDFFYDQVVMSNLEALPISQSRRKAVRDFQLQYERKAVK